MSRKLVFLLAASLLLPTAWAGQIYTLETSSTFSGGVGGSWIFSFASPAPGLYLQQLTLTMPAKVRFDTAAGGFGYGLSQGIGVYLGTDSATGLYQVTPGNSALDGGQTVTFYFNDFTAGETLYFQADVDGVPDLVPVPDCTGVRLRDLPKCLADRAAAQTTNLLLETAASSVGSAQFAGATATYVFGGPNFNATQITGTFSPTGGLLALGAATSTLDEVTENPEPGAWALLAGGLALLGLRIRRRR